MKVLFFILLVLLSTNSICQILYAPKFYDVCSQKFIKGHFDLYRTDGNVNDPQMKRWYYSATDTITLPYGKYQIDFGRIDENFLSHEIDTITLTAFSNGVDTFVIPKINPNNTRTEHSRYWRYHNCSKLCNGNEIEFYPNGVIRLKGKFNNGVPKKIKEYYSTGIIKEKAIFFKNSVTRRKIKKYNKSGHLFELIIYKKRNGKMIEKSYSR